ncbi:MAG: hypothetical protein OXL41_13210, partial [Nitrospinae bacterium]|nr:hypothetical protein [Nitrospinota bacterium]
CATSGSGNDGNSFSSRDGCRAGGPNPHASGFFSNPVIGKLLGHSKTETTARDSAQEAAERVAESIEEDMLGEG